LSTKNKNPESNLALNPRLSTKNKNPESNLALNPRLSTKNKNPESNLALKALDLSNILIYRTALRELTLNLSNILKSQERDSFSPA
ncbi:hypothetical protein, partial [Gracilibacillus dipsosauri]